MGSIADTILESLTATGLITPNEEDWLLGLLTPSEAEANGFSSEPSVRAARIVRLLTDSDPVVHQTIRAAITGQTTKQRITNKFKLEVAAALILRSVGGAEEGEKVSDIYRGLQTGFSDALATGTWQATYRPTTELTNAALTDIARGGDGGSPGLELAARAAYPLIVGRQLFPDRGTKNNGQPDRRTPAGVIERMRTDEWGVRQLGRALHDFAEREPIRAVDKVGAPLLGEGTGEEQHVTDTWLRSTFPPPGRPVAPPAPETSHEKYMAVLAGLGRAFGGLRSAVHQVLSVEGVDGRPLVQSEGVDPTNADAWFGELAQLMGLIPVWKAAHLAKHGGASTAFGLTPDASAIDDGSEVSDDEEECEDDIDDHTLWSAQP